ncbi:MAG: pyridoxine 5'-phosphate synthase [Nitrospinota bacterium]|jgi:pyridoxine 5-phosphate synthase|nr:pyridoxine 5'-phosphate synthase [Nitrospinota bacterium]
MPKLCVNVDHVATIRQARGTNEPDPVAAALIAERAGAVGITIHLREDRRHIQDRDLSLIRQVVRGKLNLEMAPVEEMRGIALDTRPDQVTLVPERREEITTEGGLDVSGQMDRLAAIIDPVQAAKILVSLFIDPESHQIEAAHRLGADYIELNTAAYSEARNSEAVGREISALKKAADQAHALGLGVHAGHGLTFLNVEPIASLPHIEELNIGHSIVSHAVFTGFEAAVGEMARLVEGRGRS